MNELLTTQVDAETMARLHARLEQSADLDVAYRTVDSPIGTLLLAATDKGLVKVGFDEDLDDLAEKISPRILKSAKRTDDVARELDEYFAGTRQRFDVPLDTRLAHGFRLEVIRHLTDIGYGETASYSRVADIAGSPKAVRAVGTACALNPLPVVLPCHRVVRADGAMGQYAGGVAAKRYLLDLERR
ncbi:MAG: Methylated-DNA--protein-cysteine methyltransferase [Nocardioidaceae bacterium]|nr:Methylated-DNA--protein-cysteine methyltransferase [Nocardioidaceae bacterium]